MGLLLGSVLGAIRGISERDRRIGTGLADNRWLSPLLVRFAQMKQGAGFYTGELKSYGIVSDSEPHKDFLLVNAATI